MIAIDPTSNFEGDVSYEADGAIAEGRDLETAIWLSLFCEAPALRDDDVPVGVTRAGWWADAFADDGDAWGSRLWLLDRAKVTSSTLSLATRYAEEALAWLVRDAIASRVEVSSERLVSGGITRGIAISIRVFRPHEATPVTLGPWEALRGI